VVGFGGKFAVEAEETLFIGREGIDIDLVLLVGVECHDDDVRGVCWFA